MPDAMDVDRPGPLPSRDPRIANRHNAPPTITSPRIGTFESQRNASLASPRPWPAIPPVVAGSPVMQPGGLPQVLLDSMQACVAIALDNARQDKLQQHNRKVDVLLQRAKLSPGFPSTVEGFQEANEKGKADLKDIDEAKRKHESEWHRTSKILEATLGSVFPQTPNFEERIARLENNYGEKLTNQRKEYEERLNSQAVQSGKTIAELQSQVTQAKSDINDINKRLDQTGSISQKMTEGLQNVQDEFNALKALVRNQTASLEQVKESVEPKASPMPPTNGHSGNVSPELESKIKDVMSRLQSLEESFARHPQPSFDVEVTVKSLSEQIRGVQTLLDMRNDFEGSEANEFKNKMAQQTEEVNKRLAQETEELNRKLAQQTEELNRKFGQQTDELNSLKAAHGHLSNEMRNMGNSIVHSNSSLSQNFNGLSVTIDRLQRINETMKTGLHSLETRYNSLSTEPIVKNMVTAMQEMYPSAAHLNEQVARLNTSVDNKLSSFQSMIDQLAHAQNAGTGDFGRLRQEFGRLSESVKTLYDTCQTPLLKLPGQMDSLEKKATDLEQSMDRNRKQLEEELGVKEKTISEAMQRLDTQRDRTDTAVEWIENHGKKIELMQQLPEAIQKLHSYNGTLSRQVGNVSRQLTSFVDDLDRVKGKSIELNDVSYRVSRMEESASTGVKANTEREKSQTNDGSPLPSREEAQEGRQEPRSSSKSQDKERVSESQQKGGGNSTAYIAQMAETNPALALREKKKKKKKKRTLSPTPSEDGRASVQPSVGGSPVSSSVADLSEKKKKKKKRKTQEGEAVLSG